MIPQDPDAVANDLQGLVTHVQRQLREVEELDMNLLFRDPKTPEQEARLEQRIALLTGEAEEGIAWALRTLHDRLLLYCEVLSLPETRKQVQAWRAQYPDDTNLGETHVWSSSDGDGRDSKALAAIRPLVDGLTLMLRRTQPNSPLPTERVEQERLEHCLRATAKLVRERNIVPTCEADIQNVMHSHLEGVFPDYTRTLAIAKPLASFKPDGGVISLRAAIECKFVGSASEVAAATRGLTEDLSGYAGSHDWTQFYTLVYMTEAFATESQVRRALGASGNAGAWTTVVVTGTGSRGMRTRVRK